MKKVMSVLMAVSMLFMMYGSVFAYSIDAPKVQAPGDASNIAGTIIGFIQWFGYAIAVGMLVYIGIKYIMASANEKADLKQALIKYVVGAILIVFAVSIAGWVFSLSGGSSGGTGTTGTASTANESIKGGNKKATE